MRTLALFITVFSGCALAQPAVPNFEVADVRIAKPGGRPNVDFEPSGRLVVRYLSMKELIGAAWSVEPRFVTGGPAWLATEHYDIVAKAPHASNEKDLRKMLQGLLAERFLVKVHTEKKVMPVYALEVDKKGVKMQQSAKDDSDSDCKFQSTPPTTDGPVVRSFACKKVSMAELAEMLPGMAPAYVDQPVVNLTGLEGAYDFTLAWTPRSGPGFARAKSGDGPGGEGAVPSASMPIEGITVFEAVRKLGLKLEGRKLPVDVFVVDSVERVPTEN
jgi:uncharacterized protein (TIGR03435 family)